MSLTFGHYRWGTFFSRWLSGVSRCLGRWTTNFTFFCPNIHAARNVLPVKTELGWPFTLRLLRTPPRYCRVQFITDVLCEQFSFQMCISFLHDVAARWQISYGRKENQNQTGNPECRILCAHRCASSFFLSSPHLQMWPSVIPFSSPLLQYVRLLWKLLGRWKKNESCMDYREVDLCDHSRFILYSRSGERLLIAATS